MEEESKRPDAPDPATAPAPQRDAADGDSAQAPKTRGFKAYWQKLVQNIQKAYRDTAGYMEACNDKNELEKEFDTHCATFTDLSDGKSVRGILEGGAVRFLSGVRFDPLHRYYSEGRTYRLNDAQTDVKLPYTAEGNPETIECYLAPFEIIVTPIEHLDAALDEYERLVKAYEPNLLDLNKQAKFDVISLFVDFRKAVAADRRDAALFDAMIPKTARFAPKAAQILADIVSNLR